MLTSIYDVKFLTGHSSLANHPRGELQLENLGVHYCSAAEIFELLWPLAWEVRVEELSAENLQLPMTSAACARVPGLPASSHRARS